MRVFALLLMACLYISCSYSQEKFRMKTVNNLQFNLPPHARIACEGWFCKKDNISYQPGSDYRYQYIIIKGLHTNSFYDALNNVNNAEYLCNMNKQDILLMHNYNITGPGTPTPGGDAAVYVSADGGTVAIEVDFDVVFYGNIRANYHRMFAELLALLYAKEKAHSWATSISQSVTEEILQLIPYPEEVSLLRYFSVTDKIKSYLLLNTKMEFLVDAVERYMDSNTGKYEYRVMGTKSISITRDENGNLIQEPFYKFQQAGAAAMPDNVFVSGSKKVLQASSADIQFSGVLAACPFVFLQQQSFKPNNTNSQPGQCAGLENDLFDICNSVLFHFDDLAQFYDQSNDLISEKHANQLSSFGFRNLITPMIAIIINGEHIKIHLRTSLSELKANRNLPRSLQLTRIWQGKYVKMRLRKNDNVILLPGDTINY